MRQNKPVAVTGTVIQAMAHPNRGEASRNVTHISALGSVQDLVSFRYAAAFLRHAYHLAELIKDTISTDGLSKHFQCKQMLYPRGLSQGSRQSILSGTQSARSQ